MSVFEGIYYCNNIGVSVSEGGNTVGGEFRGERVYGIAGKGNHRAYGTVS